MSKPLEKKRTCFNIEENILGQFKRICEREGVTMSSKVESLLRPYVLAHSPGNPQQRLDTTLAIGAPFKAETCQLCSSKPDFFGLKSGVWLGYCLLHWNGKKFKSWRAAKK